MLATFGLQLALQSCLQLCFPATAPALYGDTDGAFGLDGSLRSAWSYIDNYDTDLLLDGADDAVASETLLRLIAAGHPDEDWSYEVHGIQSVDYSSVAGGAILAPFAAGGQETRYRAFDLTWDWHETDNVLASLWLDRGNATHRVGRADITVGRQAITLGKAFFWNPLDVFLPFDPRQFDQEYKPGVDAARVDVALGRFSGASVFGVAGRTLTGLGTLAQDQGGFANASWFGSAVLGRLFSSWRGWDLALQGGKIYGGYQVGGGASGEIGPLEFRLEAAYFLASDSPALIEAPPSPIVPPFAAGEDLVRDAATVVVGTGRRFANSLTLEFEYFYNGAGDADNRDAAFLRFIAGDSLSIGNHVGGFLASYELTPLLFATLPAIVSFDDGSYQILPRLVWSVANEIEIHVGAIVNFGARPIPDNPLDLGLQSEYGTFPNSIYLQPRWYF
ncbi:MAG: hypothetical protein V3R77_07060 [Candidatus Binatia bacterium]